MFLEDSNKKLGDYGEPEIINFLNSLSKKYSVGTINEIKIMIKSFVCWHYEDFSKRFRNLDRISREQKRDKTYSPEQMLKKEDIEKLVQEEPETRWKCFFLLYFYGGFRPVEVCQLMWKEITFQEEGCFVKIVSKKNHKEFQKYIPENVCFYLKKLKDSNYDSEYVFPTKRKFLNTTKKDKERVSIGDKPMTRSGVYQHLLPLAKRVLGKHINPYILRHSIATILYNRDDLKDDDVAQQLGHSKAMKETYSHLSIDKIRERMRKIYIKPEDLPPEKKAEFERKLAEQTNLIKETKERYETLSEGFKSRTLQIEEGFKKAMEEMDNKLTELTKAKTSKNRFSDDKTTSPKAPQSNILSRGIQNH